MISISSAMPPSSPPIRAGRIWRCSGAKRKPRSGRIVLSENTVRSFLRRDAADHGQGAARARPRGHRARRPRRSPSNMCAKPGATTRSAPISKRRSWSPSGRCSMAAITRSGWTAASMPRIPMPACARRSGSAARSLRSPRRGARSTTNPRMPRRCSTPCRKTRAAMPATCSPASSGCGATTNLRKPPSSCSRLRSTRR